MAYKLLAGQPPAHPMQEIHMTDTYGWKPLSLADDEEDEDGDEEGEDDDE